MDSVSLVANNEMCWLRQLLSDKFPELNHRLKFLERKVEKDLLPFTNLPDFTEHGIKHAQKVKGKIAELIPKEIPELLTPFEIFCIICAALLHDIGMIMSKSPGEKISQIRIDHFNRSREYVIKNYKTLGLSEHEARIIGEICRAHGMPNLSYLEREVFSIEKCGEVRVQLLSALLRLADALDITSDRAPEAVSANRRMNLESRRYWKMHQSISDVQIQTFPSWDIRIIALPKKREDAQILYELRNTIQNELNTIYPVLRAAGIFFKKIELVINTISTEETERKVQNPFILLKPFDSRIARRFAGRDKEIQQMIERILGRKLVVLIGESGVGKTSLVEAGVIPQLRDYKYKIIRFSFQKDPIENLLSVINGSYKEEPKSLVLIDVIGKYITGSKKNKKLLIIGDHLEQMFTVKKSQNVRIKFVEQISRVLGSGLPITFLFCIREDYLPDLYNLSLDIPDLYDRDNTFRLHRLSRENGIEVFKRASDYARVELADQLIDRIVEDLCYEGGGMIYPPYLQIVGYRLYAALVKRHKTYNVFSVPSEYIYESLGKVKTIVNRYLEGLMDQYPHDEKAMVGQILGKMVTEYYTKKRVKQEELQKALPQCHHLNRLLTSLVQNRIVRRSLGEYELIHDFMARRVIEFIEKRKYLSRRIRSAIDFIENNYNKIGLTSGEIAKGSGVSQMHLASLFRKELGKSMNRQLNETRIAKAKELIKSRDPLNDIAKLTGFRSLSAFSRKFKEIDGMSPLEHRKTIVTAKVVGINE